MRNLVFFLLTGAALVAVAVTYLSREEAAPEGEYLLASAPADNVLSTAQAREAEPSAQAFSATPSFDVVRISRGGTGVIAGRASPGSSVQIFADQKLVGSVAADRAGEWVFILDQPLSAGPAELSLRVMGADDAVNRSRNVVVVSVPDPGGERFMESERVGVVAVLTPRDGDGASRILQKPGLSPVGEIGDSLAIDAVDYGEVGNPMISGRALPRAHVALYVDNEYMGSVRADDDGRWALAQEKALSDGPHVLRADQVIGDGDVEMRIELPFETDLPADLTQQLGKVLVRQGNSLWHIARNIYGSGIRYTVIFQENADQIRDPDLIYPGQLFTLPRLPREAANHAG